MEPVYCAQYWCCNLGPARSKLIYEYKLGKLYLLSRHDLPRDGVLVWQASDDFDLLVSAKEIGPLPEGRSYDRVRIYPASPRLSHIWMKLMDFDRVQCKTRSNEALGVRLRFKAFLFSPGRQSPSISTNALLCGFAMVHIWSIGRNWGISLYCQ